MFPEEREQKHGRSDRNRSAPQICSSMMMVCIRKEEKGESEGEIIHLNLRKPVPYQGMAELVFRIDEIARILNLPDSSQRGPVDSAGSGPRQEKLSKNAKYRSLGMKRKRESQALQKEFYQIVSTEQWKREDFSCHFPAKGIKKIVSVELLGRHYNSIQGRIRCRGMGKPYVYFRSALELMHLFAELLEDMDSGSNTLHPEIL